MSVAFTREDSAQAAQEISLPERMISPHPNLVTSTGLQALQTAIAQCRATLEGAQRIADMGQRRQASGLAARDLGYFTERLRSAEVRPSPAAFDVVAFGHRVTFLREDGKRHTYRIVGEDEGDPRGGSISYVSPMARALVGKSIGDIVDLGGREIEILEIA
jgi:transcription elongation GreA/GreB family factor